MKVFSISAALVLRARFFIDFRRFWPPFWHPNRSKMAPGRVSKKAMIFETPFYRFFVILGPHWGPPNVPKSENYSKVIPALGKYFVGSSKPYKYLINSIDAFCNQEQLLELISKNGFTNVEYRNLSNGISAIHSGWKT